MSWLVRGVTVGVAALAWGAVGGAQRRPPPEFTRQELLVANFEIDSGVKLSSARRVADDVRSRLNDLSDDREVNVISGGELRAKLRFSAYAPDSALSRGELRVLGQQFRADELVVGKLFPSPKGMQLRSQLVLMRDERFVQPLPVVEGVEPAVLAAQLTPSIIELRKQMVYERRCENHLREGRADEAVQAARAGVAAVPRGTLVRLCLIFALRRSGVAATRLLAEADHVLSLDAGSVHAIEAAAIALDTLRRRDEAAAMWLRLVATDSANLELVERVGWALMYGGNARRAEPLIARASEANPDNLRLLRQRWAIQFENRNWASAVESGARLLQTDSLALADSIFFLRLTTAYRSNNQPLKAVETVTQGVVRFPTSARLYALYTQLVRAEAVAAIPRGLELFPRSAELLALNAQALRTAGRIAESLEASRLAVSIDSSIPQGNLMIAQVEMEMGQPDSALVSLRRALARGEDTATVAQFALSKGNALLRTATGTKSRDDFGRAIRVLAFADTVRPSPQAKFLLGTAAFSVTQSALTEAPTIPEKTQSCDLAKLGAESLRLALSNIEGGQDVAPDAARQYLEYLGTLQPYVDRQLTSFCEPIPPAWPR